MPISFPAQGELLQSGQKFRREILAAVYLELKPLIDAHMTARFGVQGKETVGTLMNTGQLKPYKFAKDAGNTTDIVFRTLETYLGYVVEEFDPQALWNTIYANVVGKDTTNWDIAKRIAMVMAQNIGEQLYINLWTAERKADGTTTADLFDGFETILAQEETAGALATAKGNLLDIGAIDENNVVDAIEELFNSSHQILRRQKTKMFVPQDVYTLYNRCYRNNYGSLAYNKEFKKTFVDGSDNLCELVPMSGMSGERLILTTKRNSLIGLDQHGTRETVKIRECDNPNALQFYALSYFGTQYESIDERLLKVGKISFAEAEPEP